MTTPASGNSHSESVGQAGARPPVTVMIFTLNEELNLPGCLESVRWCDDVIVVDSHSADRTEEICRAAGVRFFQNRFVDLAVQRNWALDHTAPKHDWILILDADDRCTEELAAEMAAKVASMPEDYSAFRIRHRFYMWGRWLRHSSLYPSWVVRFIHKDQVRFRKHGHAEAQETKGKIGEIESDFLDENHKSIDEWFERQNRYSRGEAMHELAQEAEPLALGALLSRDPLARRAAMKRIAWRVPGRAPLYFVYSYLLRGGFLEGADGLAFCSMRAIYQQMIVIKKYDLRRKQRQSR